MSEKIVVSGYPKCPECGGDMVPLSWSKERHNFSSKYTNSVVETRVFAKWKCVKCFYEVDEDSEKNE